MNHSKMTFLPNVIYHTFISDQFVLGNHFPYLKVVKSDPIYPFLVLVAALQGNESAYCPQFPGTWRWIK